VTAAKIKNGAVTGSKLQEGSVTGSKISLSTLGTVPSATNANHANSADNATNAKNATNANHANSADNATNADHANSADEATDATNAANFDRYINIGMSHANLGQTVTLGSVGPFTLLGECEDNAGEPIARVFLTTTSPESNETGYEKTLNENNFEPGMKAETTYEASNGAKPEMNENYGGYYSGFNAITNDGSTIVSGEVINGVNIVGSACVYFGHMLDES
jgi:hypothetical protein